MLLAGLQIVSQFQDFESERWFAVLFPRGLQVHICAFAKSQIFPMRVPPLADVRRAANINAPRTGMHDFVNP